MGLDVNGYDDTPEWGWCKTEGCREEAFPIWKSGDSPDDPDLLLCPKHLGRLIGDLSRQVGEQNATIGYQDAMLRKADAELTALHAKWRNACEEAQTERDGRIALLSVCASVADAYDAHDWSDAGVSDGLYRTIEQMRAACSEEHL